MSARNTLVFGLLATAATASMVVAQGQHQQQMPMMGPGQYMMGYGLAPGMMGNHGMAPGMMGPGVMMGYGPMVEGRLAYLKAELGISDDEAAAWKEYESAVKARSAAMQGMHATMMPAMQTGSAVDRLKAHTQAMQSMVESLKALLPATEALYKALSDDQNKKADMLLGMGCCMM